MSDAPQGPGWWQASDDRWYPPESHPDARQHPGGPPTSPGPPGPYGYGPGGYPPYGQPYGQVGYGQPVSGGKQTDQMALWSMICGIAGIPLSCVCYIGVPALIAAIPLGIVARNRIRASGGMLTGEGMALAGIICGAVGLLLVAGLFLLWGVASVAGT